jgi:hypothetical protein
MKRLPLLSTLAGGAILIGAAGAAEAQSCFECVQQSGSNPDRPNLYCRGGDDYGACTTAYNTDPNTCDTYTTCANVYSCSVDQDPDSTCTNSTCDPNQMWDLNSWADIMDYMCYHYTTFCQS